MQILMSLLLFALQEVDFQFQKIQHHVLRWQQMHVLGPTVKCMKVNIHICNHEKYIICSGVRSNCPLEGPVVFHYYN